jgi:hypothetical protein
MTALASARWSRLTGLVAFALLAAGGSAPAGTLCGTVRDSSTLAPIAGAEAFLYEDDGAYTGLTAVTDGVGAFCIDAVPGGVYDLLVRAGDHQDAWTHDVTVTDGAVSVDVTTPSGAAFETWPNPATGAVQLRVRLDRPENARVEVFDVRGRQVHGWEGVPASGGTVIAWEARDSAGRPLAAGVYLARLQVGNLVLTRKMTLLR